MKNLVLGVIFSLFVTIGSIASVSAGSNLPDEKKKKSKSECKKECKASEKKCCESKGDSKDCKKDKKNDSVEPTK